MCDDTTEKENERYLDDLKLTRRDIGIGAAVAALVSACKPPPAPAGPEASATASGATATAAAASRGRTVTIATPDGTADAYFVAPERGPHPGVLAWPDVAGLREAYETMATRLAGAGYAVLAVNPYYRSAKAPVLRTFAEWRTDEGKAKIGPMREALTPEGIAKDGAAFAAWLDAQPEVDKRKKLATTGYCMGGPFTFRTAAAAPERVGVVASFHGAGLVTDEPTSPHLLLAKMKVAALVCVAQNDDERAPGGQGHAAARRPRGARPDGGRGVPGAARLLHHRLAGLRPRAGGALLGADARDVRGASLRGLLEAGEAAQGLAAAAAIGDDRLQKMAGRRVAPESFTHGTSEQRMQWLTRGMQSGQLSACDTFGHGTLGP